MKNYPCPKCGQPLKEILYPSNSPLNRDQWESQQAGDLLCTCHNNSRGNRPYAYFWKYEFDIGIPNVPAMVHSAERFNEKAKMWAEQALPKILELADSACGGTDEQLISEMADTLKNFAESEIAWRNPGRKTMSASTLVRIVWCNTCDNKMIHIGSGSPESATYKCQKCNHEISLEVSL